MATSSTPNAGQVAVPVSAAATLEAFAQGIESVPEGDDDGTGITLGILQATSWEGTAIGGKALAIADIVGKDIVIETFDRRPSDVSDWSPWYFLCQCVFLDSGEPFVLAVGGRNTMAQLYVWWRDGYLPMQCVATVSEKETRAGHRPQQFVPVKPLPAAAR